MPNIIIASITVLGLLFSLQSMIIGTYVLLLVLSLNIFFIILSSSIFISALKIDIEDSVIDKSELLTKFLVRLLFLLSVWHLYSIGYVFFAGIALATVIITILSIIFSVFDDL